MLQNAVSLHLKSSETVHGARRTKRLKFQNTIMHGYCVFCCCWTTTKQQNTQYPCITVFWNFNRFVLRAPWTKSDDFRCKMTAKESSFRKTEREKVFRNFRFSILEKTDFYWQKLQVAVSGAEPKCSKKVMKCWDKSVYTKVFDINCLKTIWAKSEGDWTRNKNNESTQPKYLQTDPLTDVRTLRPLQWHASVHTDPSTHLLLF